MSFQRAATFAALIMFFLSSQGLAQDVTISSHDGAVELSGTLLGYDGEFYRIDTRYGVLTVDGSGVVCSGPGCPDLNSYVAEISVSGARSMGEVLMPALVEAFARHRGMAVRRVVHADTHFTYALGEPEKGRVFARFEFRLSSSGEGFADLMTGEADIALSVREVLERERRLAFDAGIGDLKAPERSRIVALDGIVAVVAPGNPVSEITLPQLAKALTGEIRNWQELGGPEAPIILHLPAVGEGPEQGIAEMILSASPAEFAIDATRHATAASLVDAVATDQFALGISRFSETGNAQVLALGGACGFPFHVSRLTLKAEDYPLTSPLFIYTPGRRLPKLAREFLSFLRSPGAQRVVTRAGFVDQTPVEIPLDAQGDRIANAIAGAGEETSLQDLQHMIATLRRFKRLSITFRFETGSSNLDAQSRENVEALALRLEQGVFDGREIVFAGFSDGDGSADANRRIAGKRASAVRLAVIAAAAAPDLSRTELTAEAFGEAMPMACDDSDWGRSVNRRVEVWVR